MIELNVKAITDEMMALSALRAATSKESDADHECHRLLTSDHLPGLRVVIRMVFAETLLALGSAVEESNIDEEDPDFTTPYSELAPLHLGLKLRNSDKWHKGLKLTIKRHLEHIVAAGTLGWVATDGDVEFAKTLQNQREAALDAIHNHLCGPSPLMCRVSWP